jgi:peptide/bleomycin uptake transporter|tara:strand:+ start:209 stop:1180 length:972 start_codon:yes stop_codon:yes gene_type:complete
MFLFFKQKQWALWAYGGSLGILLALWYQVQLDVQINEWFGSFYDMIQQALKGEGDITLGQYFGELLSFGKIAGIYVVVALSVSFFTQHWLFRWRTSMVDNYHNLFHKARHIEGASQRVQEDTVKFSRIMEGLGVSLVESVMVIVAFFPILMGLSMGITVSFFGEWPYGLVASAIIWSVGITIILLVVGQLLRLVNIEYDIQAREAAYRKLLVVAEDDNLVRPKTLNEVFGTVRKIHYTNYARYAVFNVARLSCLQANVLVGYVVLAPAIVSGAITLGVMQQIIRAFGRVEGSMMYIFKSWPTIIELLSVYKRLNEFEKEINNA